MKKVLLLLGVICFFTACKKGHIAPSQYGGVITGYDMRKCASPACGGILITIENDTAKNPPPFYHINSTLEQLGINAGAKFPIYVDLSYRPDTGIYGIFHYIVVTQIKVVR